jgi:hypothetical protein
MAGTAKVWISSIIMSPPGLQKEGRELNDFAVLIALAFSHDEHQIANDPPMLLKIRLRGVGSLDKAALDALTIAAQFADDAAKELQRAIAEFQSSQKAGHQSE